MGVDISTAALALEAARLGAIGHISDAMAPFVSDRRYGTNFQNAKRKKFLHLVDSDDKSEFKWDPEEVYQASLNHASNTMNAKRGPGGEFVNGTEKQQM